MAEAVAAATVADWIAATAAVASAGAASYGAYSAHEDAVEARKDMKEGQAKAERLQKEEDMKAERERLEGLAQNQTATDYSNIWGVKGSNFADAAQKLSAGTGSFDTDDDEDNPFYTRGLM